MKTAAQVPQGWHDALDVNDHGLHGPGDHRQFLLEKIAGDGDAVTHDDFIAGTAHAHHVDAGGA